MPDLDQLKQEKGGLTVAGGFRRSGREPRQPAPPRHGRGSRCGRVARSGNNPDLRSGARSTPWLLRNVPVEDLGTVPVQYAGKPVDMVVDGFEYLIRCGWPLI